MAGALSSNHARAALVIMIIAESIPIGACELWPAHRALQYSVSEARAFRYQRARHSSRRRSKKESEIVQPVNFARTKREMTLKQ